MSIENENLMAKIAINKSLLKEYRTNDDPRVVYMNDGDEFQIQLFNPTTGTIGAEVSINGKLISGILVLRPGERIWLERYLTEKTKFKFTTYEVDDPDSDASVKSAIQKNGEITVKFYREDEQIKWPFYDTVKIASNSVTHGYDYATWTGDTVLNQGSTVNCLNDGQITSHITSLGCGELNTAIPTVLSDDYCDINTSYNKLADGEINTSYSKLADINGINGTVQCTTNCLSASGITDKKYSCTASATSEPITRSKSISTVTNNKVETGRIGKGSYSSQKLEEVDIKFALWHFKVETIKILPTSRKLYTANDLQKVYCTNCGRKLNPKYKFCPYCGAKCILYDE